ncbi:unnamed protein product [Peronospora belbahrii]|uniref:Expansin-like EG45 domain-containing protein n=1 Tax=Peronospora belbahrii TaxID=622444 RepID=A0ABN8CXR2_9STRA|nr:unnamed protein product [Peronospora belbahrii]
MKMFGVLATYVSAAFAMTNADEYFTGDGTSYNLGQPSAGNCNMMSSLDFATMDYVALNDAQWDGLHNCGRCAEVSCVDERCADQSKSIVVQILDRCPDCRYGDLDLSQSVFKTLTGSTPARYRIKWKLVTCPVLGNVKYCLKGGSNSYWLAVQPTNVATGIKHLQINGKETIMLGSAYYFLLDGGSQTQTDLSCMKIAMTDVNDNSMEETVSLTADKCTEGTRQFPTGGTQTFQQSTTLIQSPTPPNLAPIAAQPAPPPNPPPTLAPMIAQPAPPPNPPPTLAPMIAQPIPPSNPPLTLPTLAPIIAQPVLPSNPPLTLPTLAPIIAQPVLPSNPPPVPPTLAHTKAPPTPVSKPPPTYNTYPNVQWEKATSAPAPAIQLQPQNILPTSIPVLTTGGSSKIAVSAIVSPTNTIASKSITEYQSESTTYDDKAIRSSQQVFKTTDTPEPGSTPSLEITPKSKTSTSMYSSSTATTENDTVQKKTLQEGGLLVAGPTVPSSSTKQTGKSQVNDDAAETVNTKSGQTLNGTDPLIIVLSTLGAVGLVALIVVIVIVKRKNIQEQKARDVEVSSMIEAHSFDGHQTPSDRSNAIGIL